MSGYNPNRVPYPPSDYTQIVEREGVRVMVKVELVPDHTHPDMDETTEIVAHAAAQVSARVRESIARGQIDLS